MAVDKFRFSAHRDVEELNRALCLTDYNSSLSRTSIIFFADSHSFVGSLHV